jgi:putative Ca2+/H+ antiporter (TMEM165/GDT1 family)
LDIGIVLAVFPLIFFGELPDKTMFASLLLASRGRPLAVWVGASCAFIVHVVIAVSIGVALFHLLPTRAVDALVAVLFAVGAVLAFGESEAEEQEAAEEVIEHTLPRPHRVVATAFAVIFVAEWGDLTQVLTANLAARYHAPFSVAVGSVLALMSVAALATFGGKQLMRVLPGSLLRRVTGAACSILALVAVVAFVRG